jgi:hypothetical protein
MKKILSIISLLLIASMPSFGSSMESVSESKNNSLTLLNSTTNLETDFKIEKVEMTLTQKGFNLKISGTTRIEEETKAGSCVIQSFKGEIILPIYQAIYKNFNSSGPKNMKVKCSAKSIEGPAVILLDMGQGDLAIEHY